MLSNKTFTSYSLFSHTLSFPHSLFSHISLPSFTYTLCFGVGKKTQSFWNLEKLTETPQFQSTHISSACVQFTELKPKPELLFWFHKASVVLPVRWVSTVMDWVCSKFSSTICLKEKCPENVYVLLISF